MRTKLAAIAALVILSLIVPLGASQTYGLVGVTYLTTVESGTYTVPEGVTRLEVECVGGGGAGGGANAAAGVFSSYSVANGGGAGALGRTSFTSLSASYSYTVGTGGTGVTGATGNAGADSSFSTLTCHGGDGGGLCTSLAFHAEPSPHCGATAAGGTGTGTDFTVPGGAGSRSWSSGQTPTGAQIIVVGKGGDSHYGSGGDVEAAVLSPISNTAVNGLAGSGYGAGGSGSASGDHVGGASSATATGGAGAPGLITIREYGTAPEGEDGLDGIDCWDLDADRVNDPSEDVNEDTLFNGEDCTGPTGATGPQGETGPQGPPGPSGEGGAGNWTLRLQFEPAAAYETAPVTVYAYTSKLGTPTNASMVITISGVGATVWENDVLSVPMTYAGEPGLYVYDWTPGRLGTFNILVQGNDTVESFTWNEAVYVTEDGVYETQGSIVELPGYSDASSNVIVLLTILLLIAAYRGNYWLAFFAFLGILSQIFVGDWLELSFGFIIIGLLLDAFFINREHRAKQKQKESQPAE